MKDTYFLKKSHLTEASCVFVIMLYIIIMVLIGLITLRTNKIHALSFAAVALSTLVTWLLIKWLHSTGLYISGENVFYKNIKTQSIDLNVIAGVKIIQAYSASKYESFYPLKAGESSVYSVFLLHSITAEMLDYPKGDLWFNRDYKKHIICTAVYEKEAIEYLRTLNPNMQII